MCQVCGSSEFEVIQLSQPRGFRSWFGAAWDFDGVFEWTPRASRPKTDPGPLQLQAVANCDFWSDEAEVCVVNDNAGRQFRFLKLAGNESWVTQEAIDYVTDQITQRRLRGAPNPTFDQGEQPCDRALGSIKRTDILVVGIHAVHPSLDISPLRVEGRAALYSLGFLLRRAVSVLLDISPWEIRVGLRVTNQSGHVVGQVFLSDSLENGAGYCSHFAQPTELERLLHFVADPNGPLLGETLAPHHADACQASCPDCLRDYANLAWHCILDWRLAVDMARLTLDANAQIDFSTPHWRGLVDSVAPSYFQALQTVGWTPTTFGGLSGARSGSRGEVIVHPLWSSTNELVTQALGDARQNGVTQVQTKTLFEVLRRPF